MPRSPAEPGAWSMNMSKTYLFTVGPSTPPAMTIDSGAEIEVTVDGAFDDIEDITQVPTPFTPATIGRRRDSRPSA